MLAKAFLCRASITQRATAQGATAQRLASHGFLLLLYHIPIQNAICFCKIQASKFHFFDFFSIFPQNSSIIFASSEAFIAD